MHKLSFLKRSPWLAPVLIVASLFFAVAPATASADATLTITSPPAIAGTYPAGAASFGPQFYFVTSQVVQALDATNAAGPSTTDACTPITNAAAVAGKIALIDRGTCSFTTKVKNAQNAGAVGVIIVDNVAGGPPPPMGGADPTITIPAIRVTLETGNLIKNQLAGGAVVLGTLRNDSEPPVITPPADVTVTADPREPSAVVTFPLPDATDNLDPSPAVACVPPSGSAFPVGDTIVTCVATDFSGNSATVSFTVTVECGDPKNDPKGKKADKGKDCKGV
jgi:hypothetical protein